MKVGFLGPRGTFSEQAAREYVTGDHTTGDATLVPCRDIPELLTAVHRGEVDVGVVPAENSIEGTVVVTLDMLVHEVDLFIIGEVVIAVRHHLLARDDGRHDATELLRSIRTVISHPQALAQCRRYLQTHLPEAEMRPTLSTAAAAQEVGEGTQPDVAAVGTELCAELYGLRVVANDIQDVSDNATRFFVVTRRDAAMQDRPRPDVTLRDGVAAGGATVGGTAADGAAAGGTAEDGTAAGRARIGGALGRPTGRDKTSVVFGFAADQPGNLYGALGEFANRGINLSKLESRPAKHALGHYLFFVDLDGHVRDAAVADALEALAGRCAYVKVLGSYARASYPELTRPRAFPPSEPPDSRCL